MAWVAFETSSRSGSVALSHGEFLGELRLTEAEAHARDLLPRLDELLARAGTSAGSIEAVFAGTGPGSYTGLRIGIATALGLARGTGAGVRGVPSGEALVHGVVAPGEEAAVLLDARAGELYLARYRRTADGVAVARPPCVIAASELARELPPGPLVLGDAPALRAAAGAGHAPDRLQEAPPPRALSVLELGRARYLELGPQAPAEMEPLYLRPFAAAVRRR